MANYPTSIPSFTNKSAGQTIGSAHINSLQDEVVAIGTDILNSGITLTSGKIKFPAAQVSSTGVNDLDDYEEGTYTPTDQSGAGLTFAPASKGQYIKVGKLVHVSFVVQYPVTADVSAAKIGGLPFACNAVDSAALAVRFTDAGINFTLNVITNTTNVEMYTNAGVNVSNTNVSGKFVAGGGTYIATA